MSDNEKSRRYTDDQTDKRNHEHLSNEQDSISEADIRNVKTDESITVSKDGANGQKKNKKKTAATHRNTVNNNSSPSIETPWNILDNE